MTTLFDLNPPSNKARERSLALSHLIKTRIIEQGPLAFADFMQMSLYYPELGYYQSDDFSIGAKGDFTTAPHLTPLFAQCVAAQVEQIFTCTHTNDFLELGAGSGQFALDFIQYLTSVNALPAHYFIFEISPILKAKQQRLLAEHCSHYFDRIHWLDKLPETFAGVIFANEVLDALPTQRFQIQHHPAALHIVYENQQLTPVFFPIKQASFLEKIQYLQDTYQLNEGYESEYHLTLPNFINSLTACLQKGVILLADYGYGEALYYHPERKFGTLTCFFQHHRHNNPLLWPGLQDITAHVNFTQVAESAANAGADILGFTHLAGFLLSTHLLERAQVLENKCNEIEKFHLHQAIKRLTLPQEMGETIKVIAIAKHIEQDLLGFNLQDRKREL